jgi:hypothetical protein
MALLCVTCRPRPQAPACSAPPQGGAAAAIPTEASSATASGKRTPTAKELGELLPHWYKGHPQDGDPPGPAGYASLKAAAFAMALAPEQERRNVIAAYSWAYCEMALPDAARASGMFLLLRVLFVVPEGPLHPEAGNRVLRVDPCCGNRWFGQGWFPLVEYDAFARRFPRRTPAEIEALEIK